MDYRPIKVRIFACLTAADKARLYCCRHKGRFAMADSIPKEPETQNDPEAQQIQNDPKTHDTKKRKLSSSPSPVYEFESDSSSACDTEVNEHCAKNSCPDMPKEPNSFGEAHQKHRLKVHLLNKKRDLEAVNVESMWVELIQYNNVIQKLTELDNF